MCLARVNKKAKLPQEVVAYKVLSHEYKDQLVTAVRSVPVTRGKWVEAEPNHLDPDGGIVLKCDGSEETYPIGFHAYEKHSDAKRGWGGEVYEVLLRDICAAGWGDGTCSGDHRRQWVAKKMKVLRKAKTPEETT